MRVGDENFRDLGGIHAILLDPFHDPSGAAEGFSAGIDEPDFIALIHRAHVHARPRPSTWVTGFAAGYQYMSSMIFMHHHAIWANEYKCTHERPKIYDN